MIAYLDTQVVMWLMQPDLKRLSRDAIRMIETAELLVSPIVSMELEILHEIGRSKRSWQEVSTKLQAEIGIRLCDLSLQRITYVALGESWTRDPFDRMIVANAKANELAYLISADEHIRKHYQRAVW